MGRLSLALGFFVAALITHNIAFAAVELAACIILLRAMNGSWTSILRAMRLLLWLLLPVFLLHLLFTPGSLMWPGSGVPFTWEGWDRAAWLGSRLFLLFFSAMLLSRALTLEEWQAQLCHIPGIGRHLFPYLQLFHPMWKMTAKLARKHWHENRSRAFRALPETISALLENVLKASHEQASTLWANWDGALPPCDRRIDGRALLLVLCGFCLPLLAWIS